MRPATAVFIGALVVRSALLLSGPWADPGRALEPDSARYLILADNLRAHRTFGKAQEDGLVHLALQGLREANGTWPVPDRHGLRPEAFRTPGYPAFLALLGSLDDDLRLVLAVQCVLGALMAVAVVLVARALGIGERGAVVAGWLWAIHPGLAVHDTLILSESLFNVLTLTALLVASRVRSGVGAAIAGLIIGAAALVRPLGLLYLPAAMVLIARGTPRRLLTLSVLTVVAAAPSAVWAIRNHQAGEGLRVSTVADVNLLFYTASYAITEERGEDWFESWPARVKELSARLSGRLGPGDDVIAAARRLAVEEIAARPSAAIQVQVKSVLKLMIDHSATSAGRLLALPYEPSGMFSRIVLNHPTTGTEHPWSLATAVTWTALNLSIAIAAALGMADALWRRRWSLVVACGMTLALFAIATGSVGLERFRLPMMFPLVVLAASVIWRRGAAVANALRAAA